MPMSGPASAAATKIGLGVKNANSGRDEDQPGRVRPAMDEVDEPHHAPEHPVRDVLLRAELRRTMDEPCPIPAQSAPGDRDASVPASPMRR
jgi:hypothetical protein